MECTLNGNLWDTDIFDMKRYTRVLTIAGSDSGGGAGIQADIKTISACGCYASSVITAVTVQNTLGVHSVEGITPETVGAQIDAVLDDIGTDAVKIGMLFSDKTVRTVAGRLAAHHPNNIVLDPVMVSTSGHRLIEESAVSALTDDLIGKARVITPNIPEAEILLGHKINGTDAMKECAEELGKKFSVSVFLKAGHLDDSRVIDWLYNAESGEMIPLESERIETRNTHGTGCTLSSALASFLALGMPLNKAAAAAKQYLFSALVSGAEYETGHGYGPVNHFWNFL